MIKYNQPKEKNCSPDKSEIGFNQKNFNWNIDEVHLKMSSGVTKIDVEMEKEGVINIRQFTIEPPSEWTEEEICIELLKLDAFNGSKKIV